MEKIQVQLKWPSFPGVHSLLLKGCTNPGTYEATIQALSRFTTLLDFTVIDPSQVSQEGEKYDFIFETCLVFTLYMCSLFQSLVMMVHICKKGHT